MIRLASVNLKSPASKPVSGDSVSTADDSASPTGRRHPKTRGSGVSGRTDDNQLFVLCLCLCVTVYVFVRVFVVCARVYVFVRVCALEI